MTASLSSSSHPPAGRQYVLLFLPTTAGLCHHSSDSRRGLQLRQGPRRPGQSTPVLLCGAETWTAHVASAVLGIEHVASRRIGGKGEFPGRSAQTSSRRERASETEREQSERQSERQHESQRRCAHATACKGRKAHTSTPAVLLCSCCTHNSYTLLFNRLRATL